MFPQLTGKLTIPSITFNGIVVQQNRNIDPFEAFFNGGSGYVEVKKQIIAPSIDIQVDPLPQRPANFSGGVGKFSISAQLDKTEAKANDPISLRVIVSGVGNLKLIKQPQVEFPKDFDKYDAKITDKTKLTSNGLEGSMIYDILAVPRHPGKFEIPPVEFVFFNTATRQYETVKSEGFTLDVAKGSGSAKVSDFTGQEDLQLLNKDIRHIKTNTSRQHSLDDFFFGSTGYWLSLSVLALVFICVNLFKPEIHSKTLMPALQSPWFAPHVIVYMFAYAVLGASTVMALYLLCFKKGKVSDEEYEITDNLVYVGLAFMTIGMLFGALWAKEAWGHYWSWDPKETWAAITWFSYLIYIHYRQLPQQKSRLALGMLILSFILLQMCWWGINYLPAAQGSSVHTYST
jgi:multisubunit Na+/H+ antiporter MnhB subunit